MPGPLLTATISESSRRGFVAGPLMIAGHGILELFLVVALLLGLAPFFQDPMVFVATAFFGSLVLLWMAYGMFRSLPSLRLSFEEKETKGHHPITSGILMSLANPYWFIWWATIGLGYIVHSSQYGLWGIAAFFSGHILADLGWYSLVSAAVAKGRHYLTNRLYRGLIAGCAAFLVFFAGYFLHAAIGKLVETGS